MSCACNIIYMHGSCIASVSCQHRSMYMYIIHETKVGKIWHGSNSNPLYEALLSQIVLIILLWLSMTQPTISYCTGEIWAIIVCDSPNCKVIIIDTILHGSINESFPYTEIYFVAPSDDWPTVAIIITVLHNYATCRSFRKYCLRVKITMRWTPMEIHHCTALSREEIRRNTTA